MQPTIRNCGLALAAALVCSAANAGWNNQFVPGRTTPDSPYGMVPQYGAYPVPGMASGGVGGAMGFGRPGLPASAHSGSRAMGTPTPGMTPMPGAATYGPAISPGLPANAASPCGSDCGSGFSTSHQPNTGNYGGPVAGRQDPVSSPIGAPPITTGTEYGPGPVSYDSGLMASDAGWNENPYLSAMQAPWQVPCGPAVPVARPCVGPRWFGGVYGLYMNRDDNNQIHFLTDPAVSGSTYLCSPDADMEYSGGYEVRLGRTFHDGGCGVEFVYWELFPGAQDAAVSLLDVPGANLYGTMDYRDVYLDFGFGPDTIANQFTDSGTLYGALLQRDWEFRNIEVNLLSRPIYAGGGFCFGRRRCQARGCGGLGGPGCYGPAVGGYGGSGACGGSACGLGPFPGAASVGGCGLGNNGCPPRLHIGWSAGVRYFRFDESLRLTYDNFDGVYDGANPDTEFDHFTAVENDMVGAQLGLNLDYYLSRCIHLELGSKMGLYGNRVDHAQRIYNGYGDAYVFPGAGAEFVNVQGDDVDVAFLGELRAGLAYRVGCHWRLAGGYRAIAASGVALATNQLPFGRAFNNLASIGSIDRNGDLILHGLYAGVEFAW